MGFHTVQKVFAAQHGLSGRALATLLVLAHRTDDATGQSWPSRKAISFSAGHSLRTTTRALSRLEQAGVLLINRRASGCRRNLYTIDSSWLEMQSVRGCRTTQKRDPQPVQKPVEKFLKSCGRVLKKAVDPPATGANSGTRSYKEVLSKNQVVVETGTATAGCERPFLLEPIPDLTPLFSKFSMNTPCRPRSRALDSPPISYTHPNCSVSLQERRSHDLD